MKRKLSIILVLALLITFAPANLNAQANDNYKVRSLYNNGIIFGREDGQLHLDSKITRAEFTTLLVHAMNLQNYASAIKVFKYSFKDVDQSHWAFKNIEYLKSLGIVYGFEDNTFRPDKSISYEEVIAIITRLDFSFNDTNIQGDYWANKYILHAFNNGFLSEVIINNYKGDAIREKVFEILYNSLGAVSTYAKIISNNNTLNNNNAKDNIEDQDSEDNLKSNNRKKHRRKFNNSYDDLGTNDDSSLLIPKEKEEIVNIPDPLFKKVLNKNIDINRPDDMDITVKDMEKLKVISHWLDKNGKPGIKDDSNVSILGTPKSLEGTDGFKFMISYGIKSIEGIQYAKNLEVLKLNEHEIADISYLKNLNKLKYLEISRNRITDISALKNLTNLTFLKLYNNWIEDISPVESLVNLELLDVHNNVRVKMVDGKRINTNGVKDITAIKDLKKLKTLDLSANSIEDVSVIKGLNMIKDMDLSGNHIFNYTGLDEYFANITKNVNNGVGSLNFWAQSRRLEDEVEVANENICFASPYLGLKDLFIAILKSTSEEEPEEADLLDALENYTTVSSNDTGINASYDYDNNKINCKFTNEYLIQNKGSKKEVTFNIEFAGTYSYSFTVSFNFSNDIDTVVASGNISNIYKEMFNKYSKSERRYTNLTDEGNRIAMQKRGIIKDSVIRAEDMKYLKTFSIVNKDVDDDLVKPLLFANNLEEFKVTLNNKDLKRDISDFSFLQDKEKLRIFYYQNQDLKDNVAGYPKKYAMTLFAPLKNLKNLKDFRANYLRLVNLRSLEGLKLETLSLQDDEITSIDSLRNIDVTDRLDLENNKIRDISPLEDKSELKTLYLYNNPISDISALKNLRSLEALHLRKTNIDNINDLEHMDNIHRLYIDKNNLNSNYMNSIKTMSGLNTLFVTEINKDDFEFLKEFLIRPAVAASYGEDAVRMFNFDEFEIELEIRRDEINNNPIAIDNPLKDWDGNYLEQDTYGSQNEKIQFQDDKILIQYNGEDALEEAYNIYIENYDHTYGDYSQPASLSGKVVLKIKMID